MEALATFRFLELTELTRLAKGRTEANLHVPRRAPRMDSSAGSGDRSHRPATHDDADADRTGQHPDEAHACAP